MTRKLMKVPNHYRGSPLEQHIMSPQNTEFIQEYLKSEYDVDRIAKFLEHAESLVLFKRLTFSRTLKNYRTQVRVSE